MPEYISKESVLLKCADIWDNADETTQTGVDTINTIDKITDFIESLPTADVQPVDRWISVDERLPKTGESVLVYVAINKNLKGFGECKPEIRIGWLDDGGKWALQFSNMDYSEVLCWLPLPEPPKDGDAE